MIGADARPVPWPELFELFELFERIDRPDLLETYDNRKLIQRIVFWSGIATALAGSGLVWNGTRGGSSRQVVVGIGGIGLGAFHALTIGKFVSDAPERAEVEASIDEYNRAAPGQPGSYLRLAPRPPTAQPVPSRGTLGFLGVAAHSNRSTESRCAVDRGG